MHVARSVLAAMAAGALAVTAAAPGSAALTTTVAEWQLNEPAGAGVMADSSGNGIDGVIGSAVVTDTVVAGATGYRWTFVRPNEPPAKPERLVTIDDPRMNPGSGDFAITIRFRTTHSFGNMLQKGQAGSKGGYFKWQIPKGKLTCLFRGYDAQGNRQSKAVNSGAVPLNDGDWHVVRCARTSDRLTMTIDGERTRRAWGPTGTIANKVPLTLGGKRNCDQIRVTCDYFAGDMDYVRIESD
ncbi:MAG TPA: LamG domain-containing protein [Nocardioidaceae bacterium]|nr:LamG domain-containing protein [Nocardioidaceae bacterium]